MKKYAVLLLTTLMLMAAPSDAFCQNKKQLEKDKAKIEREIARLNGELKKAKNSSKKSTKQIQLLNKRIAERTKLIDNINGQMNILDRRIHKTEDSLRVVRNQIEEMKGHYAKTVRQLYHLEQNVNKMGLLFDNATYNDSYLKLKYFKEYSRYCRHEAVIIERRQQLFENMSLDLQRQKNEKSTLLQQQRKQKEQLAREQQREQKNLSKTQQQEKDLSRQISRKEQQKRKLQQQIQQLINAEVAKNSGGSGTTTGKGSTSKGGTGKGSGAVHSDAASADFVAAKGRMPWPVYYKGVSREYGRYRHASGGENMNYGIDLTCASGAAVTAVAAGTVASVFTTPTGDKGVIVRHGAYMTVYAGLGTVSVSKDSKVSTRQSIGTVAVGDDGTSEFSFQVWCGRDALNPRHWLR